MKAGCMHENTCIKLQWMDRMVSKAIKIISLEGEPNKNLYSVMGRGDPCCPLKNVSSVVGKKKLENI